MLHTNDAPKKWKKHCFLISRQDTEDKYGCQLKTDGKKTEIEVCIRALSEEKCTFEQYGIKSGEAIEFAFFGDDEVNLADIIETNEKRFEIRAVVPFPSYRLIIAERV